MQDDKLARVEWLSYSFGKFTRLLEAMPRCSKMWESPAKHCVHDRISSTTGNAFSSIVIPRTVPDKHDVLLNQHSTFTPVMFVIGAFPKVRFLIPHQNSPDCCRRLVAGFLESNRPLNLGRIVLHHIV